MQQQLFELASNKYFGIYRGQVLNNVDPDKAGKVQVAVGPMFLGIAATTPANLPWAFPGMPLMFGSGSSYGNMNIPAVNSWVYCFFIEGDCYQPCYFLEAPTLKMGVPPNIKVDYPNTRGFTSPSGIQVSIDDTAVTATITMPGGASIVLNNNTTLTIICPTRVIVQSPEISASGNVTIASGATGTIGSTDGSLVTVLNGIITDID